MENVRKFHVVVGPRRAWRSHPEYDVYLVAFCKVLYGMGFVPMLYSHESPQVCQFARDLVFSPDNDRMNRARIYILEHPEFKDLMTFVLNKTSMFNDLVQQERDAELIESTWDASAIDSDLRLRLEDFSTYWSTGRDPNRPLVSRVLDFIRAQFEDLVEVMEEQEKEQELGNGVK